jgi:tetratricopeptide (TPR) repeat protein
MTPIAEQPLCQGPAARVDEPAAAAPLELPSLPEGSCARSTVRQERRRQGRLLALALLRRPRRLLVLGCVLLLLLPTSVLLGRRLLALHHLKAGRDALERYHQDEARPHLEACLRLWPNKGEALLLMARAARRSDAHAAAEEYLEQYQRLHGQSEEWLLERLLHTAAKGETDKVANYCRRLVEENSTAGNEPVSLGADRHQGNAAAPERSVRASATGADVAGNGAGRGRAVLAAARGARELFQRIRAPRAGGLLPAGGQAVAAPRARRRHPLMLMSHTEQGRYPRWDAVLSGMVFLFAFLCRVGLFTHRVPT